MGNVFDGIVGVAIGDALGVPVEFESRIKISENPVTGMREYGTHHQPKGTWSDDTSLTLALLDSIIKNHCIHYTDIMDKFSQWLLYGEYTATGKVFDVGNATNKAIINYGRSIHPLNCGGLAEYENGNGSLMRILPIVYYIQMQPDCSIDEKMKFVHNISSLTHRHPISLLGCGIYVNIALKLLTEKGTQKEIVKRGIEEAFLYYESQGYEDLSQYTRLKDLESFAAFSSSNIKSSGYVVDTLEAAIWCFINTRSFRDCVLKAINLGDDTDTVGAVAGGLAGIYYGANNIPEEWLKALLKIQYIWELCSKMEHYMNENKK